MKASRKSVLPFAAALALAGCTVFTVGPDYERPEVKDPAVAPPDAGCPTTNKTETGEIKPADAGEDARKPLTRDMLARWWASFDDPVLAELVDRAVTNNLTYLMAQQRLLQARWQYKGSAADLLPHVAAQGSATINEYGSKTPTGSSAGRHLHTDRFSGGFDASWEIDIFGGVNRQIEASRRAVYAAGYDVESAWVSLTAEIGAQYVNLRTVQRRLKVARANLKLQAETYDLLAERFGSGIGDKLAVSQSKYILEQTRAQIPLLIADEEALVNALEILAGAMPGTLHGLLLPCPDREWLLEPQKLESIPLDMMRARPDVMAAEQRLAAQVAAVGVAKSMYFPKLHLNGTLGLESAKFDNVFHRPALVGSIGPSLSWPIFQGGAIYANVKTEESKMAEAVMGYELAVQKAFAETRNAYAAYTRQYHRHQSLEAAVKAAQEAATIAQDLYTSGLADFNNVLDAQRSLLSLEEALAVSNGQITVNLIALYKALGGGIAR